jgi:hypothetical protein
LFRCPGCQGEVRAPQSQPEDDTALEVAEAAPPEKLPETEEVPSKPRPAQKETGLAAAYMKQARARLRDEEKRSARPARTWGGGITILNVHFSNGVILGTLGLIAGLCWLVGGLAYRRLYYGSLIVIGLSVAMLYRALVLGEED